MTTFINTNEHTDYRGPVVTVVVILVCVCVQKMAGQFRSSQWDPILIVAQIIAMQCLFYVGLGSCVAVIDFILGYSRSLSQLFLYQVHYSHASTSDAVLFVVSYT